MKKHDEGYVLAYVTVVLLIFTLVAALILTDSHRNLKYQQDSILQMQNQYVAEGKIEEVLAQWATLKSEIDPGEEVSDTGVVCESIEEGVYELTATAGNVQVTCKVDGDGKVIEYQISAFVQPSIVPEGV